MTVYRNLLENITSSGKKILKAVRLKSEALLSPYILNIVLEVLDRTIGQLKEIKQIQIGNENIKVFLSKSDMIYMIYIAIKYSPTNLDN